MASENSEDRRKAIRAEIAKTSREEFMLKEMKRLGFWPKGEDKPTVAEEFLEERKQLSSEVRELSKKHREYSNKEAVLAKFKKERMRASREQQKANKLRREEERLQKVAEYQKKLESDIFYLGEEYSAGLNSKENDLEKLAMNKLPIIQDVMGLSRTLGVKVSELRYLAYYRPVSKVSHYMRYTVPKKSGGVRNIAAPMPRMKSAQRAILDEILSKMKVSEYAHGFVGGKSIVSNAIPHVGADVVINMDLKDFFPSFDYKRVFGMYKALGFSIQNSIILSLISTEPIEEKIKVDGEVFYYSEGERVLPQGAPSSPMITNIICRRMDQRMAGIARKLGFSYSRYADDMTFSCSAENKKNLYKLKWQTKAVIKDEDFTIHPNKTHIMNSGNRKEVTGIVVNEKPSISRKKMKAFRALLFQIEKDGIKGKHWGESKDVVAATLGFARYVYMVDPEKGKELLKRAKKIHKKYAPPKAKKKKIKKEKSFKVKTSGSLVEKLSNVKGTKSMKREEKKPWWKIW